MKNKMFKKLAAAGAAFMMAVTGMAVNVSAASSTQTWMVRRVIVNGSISSESVSTSKKYFVPSTLYQKYTRVYDKCTSYSSGTTGNGLKLGADYWLYKQLADGSQVTYLAYKNYKSTGEKDCSLSTYVTYGTYLTAEHTIDNNYSISCYISGDVTGYYS